MTFTKVLYAIEFLPLSGEGGIGGMDWFHCEDDAMARYRQLVERGDPGSVALHEIEVDAADNDAVTDLIGDYLDEPEKPALLTSTWPVDNTPCVLVEQGNLYRAVWEYPAQSLAELIATLGGDAEDATWRSWNLPDATTGILYDALCDTAQISIDDANRPTLSWLDDKDVTHRVQGKAVEPQYRDGYLAVINNLELIAASLSEALVARAAPPKPAGPAPMGRPFSAPGVSFRVTADLEAATAADPDGVVTSCEVAGHPGVTVHSHSSTTVDGAVTVLVDAPEGTTIRFDVNDASLVATTVGDDTLHVPRA